MGEWKEKQLCELVDIGSSKRIFYKEYVSVGIPFYRSKEVIEKHNGKAISTELHISIEKYNDIKEKFGVPVEGDMLLTSVGTLGIPYIVQKDEKFYFKDGNLTWFRNFNNSLLNQFLYYWLNSPIGKGELDMVSIGSTQPAITIRGLKGITINAPPLPEQKTITGVLSSLDDKIDLLNRQNKTLEAMAGTLFRQWFPPTLKLRRAGVEEAMADWGWVELGQFVEVMRGLSYKGSGLCSKDYGVPMHNLNSVYEGGGYKYKGIKYYSGNYKERHLISPGDIIITNTEQGHDLLLIGFPAIVPRYFGDSGIFSQHIYKLRIKDKYISEPFLYYLLMSYDVREQITGATNGSTVNMLPKDGIEWAKFRLPPEFLIKQFTTIVEPYFNKKEHIHSQIRTLEKLRDTLLPKLMNGEVRVKM